MQWPNPVWAIKITLLDQINVTFLFLHLQAEAPRTRSEVIESLQSPIFKNLVRLRLLSDKSESWHLESGSVESYIRKLSPANAIEWGYIRTLDHLLENMLFSLIIVLAWV